MESQHEQKKDGRIVDSLGVSPVMHNFRIIHMDRALSGDISAFVVGFGPNDDTLVFERLDFGPDILCLPGCHIHAQSIEPAPVVELSDRLTLRLLASSSMI